MLNFASDFDFQVLIAEIRPFTNAEDNQLLEIDPNHSIAFFHKACIESERNNKEQSLQLL